MHFLNLKLQIQVLCFIVSFVSLLLPLPSLLLAQAGSTGLKLVLPRTRWYDFDTSHPEHRAISDGQGGAIVIGKASGLPYLIIQRIDRYGDVLWSEPGQARQVALRYHGFEEGFQPILMSDGDGGVFVAYVIGTEFIPPLYHNLYLQHFSADFDRLWGEGGLSVVPDSASPDNRTGEWPLNLVPDGEGGVLLFYIGPISSIYGSTYVQRIDASGHPLWGDYGKPLTEEGLFLYALPDGNGGAYLVGTGLGAQRVSKDGEYLWPDPVIPGDYVFGEIQLLLGDTTPPTLTIVGMNPTVTGIVAQRLLLSDGTPYWGTLGSTWNTLDSSRISYPVVTQNGNGGAYIFWRNVMQEIDSLGRFRYETPKTIIGIPSLDLGVNSAAFVEGLGTFVIGRGCPSPTECSKLFIQKISIEGELPWGLAGRVLIDTLYYVSPAIILANDRIREEAFVFFELEGGIYAQRVSLISGTVITGVVETYDQTPNSHLLFVSPNPFVETVRIKYHSENFAAKIQNAKIYNAIGQVTFDFGTTFPTAGDHEFVWRGINAQGTRAPAGLYFFSLVTNESVVRHKLILLK